MGIRARGDQGQMVRTEAVRMTSGRGSCCWVRLRVVGGLGGWAASRGGGRSRRLLSNLPSRSLSVELDPSFIQHVFTEHLLCARHYDSHWRSSREQTHLALFSRSLRDVRGETRDV